MELYEVIRARQDNLINQNAASIVITRTTRTRGSDRGLVDSTSTIAAQTVRIYAKLRYTKVVNINEAGWTIRKTQKMIAQYDCNILAESESNLDKFTYNSKTYKVVDVIDMFTQNQICFKEVEIEAVN